MYGRAGSGEKDEEKKDRAGMDRAGEDRARRDIRMGMIGSIKKRLRDNVLFLTAVAFLLLADLRSDLYYIRTGSMEPELPVGTVVVTDRYAEPEIGAVFAYQSGGNIIIHRIIGGDGDGYVTKGDANPVPDAVSVAREQIKGKVVLELTILAPILRVLGIV